MVEISEEFGRLGLQITGFTCRGWVTAGEFPLLNVFASFLRGGNLTILR
jgi:hypothetical protein